MTAYSGIPPNPPSSKGKRCTQRCTSFKRACFAVWQQPRTWSRVMAVLLRAMMTQRGFTRRPSKNARGLKANRGSVGRRKEIQTREPPQTSSAQCRVGLAHSCQVPAIQKLSCMGVRMREKNRERAGSGKKIRPQRSVSRSHCKRAFKKS